MQHRFFGRIAEIDIGHTYIAAQLGICNAAVAVRMLPCPSARMMICLADAAVVGNLRVYERDISVVGLGLRVDKREDTLSARHCKHYRVYLLRDLIDISVNCLVMLINGTSTSTVRTPMPAAIELIPTLGRPESTSAPPTVAQRT